jgi:hypothetical protein
MQPGSVRGRTVLRAAFYGREPIVDSMPVSTKKARVDSLPACLSVPLFTIGFLACFFVHSLNTTYAYSLRSLRGTTLQSLPSTNLLSSPPGPSLSVWDQNNDKVFLRTDLYGVSSSVDVRQNYINVVAPMYDGAMSGETMVQVLDFVANISPGTTLRIYVGLHQSVEAHKCYIALHNTTAPANSRVEFVATEFTYRTTTSRRTHVLAARALADRAFAGQSDEVGFILIVHHSCILDSELKVGKLAPDGRGFLLLRTPIKSHTLHQEIDSHDLGLTSDPLFSHDHVHRPGTVQRTREAVLHCSGSLMHAMNHLHK